MQSSLVDRGEVNNITEGAAALSFGIKETFKISLLIRTTRQAKFCAIVGQINMSNGTNYKV